MVQISKWCRHSQWVTCSKKILSGGFVGNIYLNLEIT